MATAAGAIATASANGSLRPASANTHLQGHMYRINKDKLLTRAALQAQYCSASATSGEQLNGFDKRGG